MNLDALDADKLHSRMLVTATLHAQWADCTTIVNALKSHYPTDHWINILRISLASMKSYVDAEGFFQKVILPLQLSQQLAGFYAALIQVYQRDNRRADALAVLPRMLKAGIPPDKHLYSSMLKLLSQAHLSYNWSQQIWNVMKENNMLPGTLFSDLAVHLPPAESRRPFIPAFLFSLARFG